MLAIKSFIVLLIVGFVFCDDKSWIVNFKSDIEIKEENFDAVEKWIVS